MDISPKALFEYMLDDLRAVNPQAVDASLCVTTPSDFWPGASPQDIAILRLVRSFYKKYVDDTAANADELCLDKFLASDLRCQEWELRCRDSLDVILIGELKSELDNFFHPEGEFLVKSYFDLLDHGRMGPGASLGANGVDFYTKLFSSRLTATSPEIYKLYVEYITWFSVWADGEISRLACHGLPEYTSCSQLSFVRKTRDISRSICTEPSLNMFFQLGFGEIIAKRLRWAYGLDIDTQAERNRRLAYYGSINNSVATIDLESASDSVSLNLIDEILPGWVSDLLKLIRTPKVMVERRELTLNMVSTMGNGFTFPLQTTIFACIVRAVANSQGFSLGRCDAIDSAWGVFGDDIVAPIELVPRILRLLTLCGFVVNSSKSYLDGPFRESCGHDYYCGRQVRGIYIKSLRSQQDRYIAINSLNEWTARQGIPLPRSVGYLIDSVRYLAVPPWENLDAGIKTSSPPSGSWHSAKQRFLYRCSTPIPLSLDVGEDAVTLSRGFWGRPQKSRSFNPSGLWVSFIGGYVRNCRISVALKQGDKMRYRTTVRVAPNWSFSNDSLGFAAPAGFWMLPLKAALELNNRFETEV